MNVISQVFRQIAMSVVIVSTLIVTIRGVPLAQRQSGASQYLDKMGSASVPAWDRLVPGQSAILGPVGADSNRTQVCDSAEADRDGEQAFRCPTRLAGQVVTIQDLRAFAKSGDLDEGVVAQVTGANNSWSGYVPATSLRPIVPLPLTLHTRSQRYAVPTYKTPYIASTQDPPPQDASKQPGLAIGSATVRLVKFYPFIPSYGKLAKYDSFVIVLSGKAKGQTGWMAADYLETSGGYSINCFCLPE